MILRSFENYPVLMEVSDDFTVMRPLADSSARATGKFSKDGAGNVFAFFRRGGSFYFHAPTATFTLGEGSELKIKSAAGITKLTLVRPGSHDLNFEFIERTDRVRTVNDLTPFIDDEDFSFPEFVSNVLANPQRQMVLLHEW